MEMIQIESIRQFPDAVTMSFSGRTIEDARRWAEKRGARWVWFFVHKIGKFGVLAAVLADEKEVHSE